MILLCYSLLLTRLLALQPIPFATTVLYAEKSISYSTNWFCYNVRIRYGNLVISNASGTVTWKITWYGHVGILYPVISDANTSSWDRSAKLGRSPTKFRSRRQWRTRFFFQGGNHFVNLVVFYSELFNLGWGQIQTRWTLNGCFESILLFLRELCLKVVFQHKCNFRWVHVT